MSFVLADPVICMHVPRDVKQHIELLQTLFQERKTRKEPLRVASRPFETVKNGLVVEEEEVELPCGLLYALPTARTRTRGVAVGLYAKFPHRGG